MATRAESGAIQYAEVPDYTLPPLLRAADGSPVTSAEAWQSLRRPELQQLLERQMMGRAPPLQLPSPSSGIEVRYEVLAEQPAFGGSASQRDVAMVYEHVHSGASARVDLLLFLPAAAPAPAVPWSKTLSWNLCSPWFASEKVPVLRLGPGRAATGSSAG